MLRNALINTLMHVSETLDATIALDNKTAATFYTGTNAGKHIRHILDHILALFPALETGILDYNLRNRDSIIETDCRAAKQQLDTIMTRLHNTDLNNRDITIISEIDSITTANTHFTSNIDRELLYLVNHTMHHVAYTRLLAKGCGINLPNHIGIAPATATYMRATGT